MPPGAGDLRAYQYIPSICTVRQSRMQRRRLPASTVFKDAAAEEAAQRMNARPLDLVLMRMRCFAVAEQLAVMCTVVFVMQDTSSGQQGRHCGSGSGSIVAAAPARSCPRMWTLGSRSSAPRAFAARSCVSCSRKAFALLSRFQFEHQVHLFHVMTAIPRVILMHGGL